MSRCTVVDAITKTVMDVRQERTKAMQPKTYNPDCAMAVAKRWSEIYGDTTAGRI